MIRTVIALSLGTSATSMLVHACADQNMGGAAVKSLLDKRNSASFLRYFVTKVLILDR